MSTWGHGQGRLTADKCRKLQNYFHGAILGNKGKPKEMEIAIWASLFHCTSTDTDPHHGRCPDGDNSWCFYKKAQALGEQPGPHADNLTTDISREVAQQLLPLYRRMSCNTLLSKVLQGKTQNNESLNSMIWAHCPKTVFVGKRRIDSAVATAVCKFIRGNLFLAELMDTMLLQPSEFTINFLEATDVAAFRVHHQHPGGHRHCQAEAGGQSSRSPVCRVSSPQTCSASSSRSPARRPGGRGVWGRHDGRPLSASLLSFITLPKPIDYRNKFYCIFQMANLYSRFSHFIVYWLW